MSAQGEPAQGYPRVKLDLYPATRERVRAWVKANHRHSKPPTGYKFAIEARNAETGAVVGYGVAGRPVARALDDGLTVEVTRVCTDGTFNACSRLYGALCRAAGAMGYRRAVTYTLTTEDGGSLRGSGWTMTSDRERSALDWQNRNGRAAQDLPPRIRWEKAL